MKSRIKGKTLEGTCNREAVGGYSVAGENLQGFFISRLEQDY